MKIQNHRYDINIAKLKEEHERLQEYVQERQNLIRVRQDELDDLEGKTNRADRQIKDLSDKLRQKSDVPPPILKNIPSMYNIARGDLLDEMLGAYINKSGCPVPIKKLGHGYYMFGTRKIYAKILNGKLVIRVGGGYMVIEEFISTYAEGELNKMAMREEKAAVG